MAGVNEAGGRIVWMLIFGMLALFAADATAFAQAGSTGGTIGNTDKSVSGGSEAEPSRNLSHGQKSPKSAGPKVFENPTLNGIRVDRCMAWGPTGCNAPAANHWCRSKGFARATDSSWEVHQPTIFQDPASSVKVCDHFYCGAFTRVVCE
jgi:hypothetical protein